MFLKFFLSDFYFRFVCMKKFLYLLTVLIGNNAFSQIESYGNVNQLEDTIVISRKAPEWNGKGYKNLEAYLEDKLYFDIQLRSLTIPVVGVYASVVFTIDNKGFARNAQVNCTEFNLVNGIIRALDSMPAWKPGIKNDKNIDTKMEYYFLISKIEAGQFVVQQDRIPPKLQKSTLPLKIGSMSVCIGLLLVAWNVF